MGEIAFLDLSGDTKPVPPGGYDHGARRSFELWERLEAATEPSLHLDEVIARYLGWTRKVATPRGFFWIDQNGIDRGQHPYLTSSVDTVLRLRIVGNEDLDIYTTGMANHYNHNAGHAKTSIYVKNQPALAGIRALLAGRLLVPLNQYWVDHV